jgi:hypothetical protein
MPAQEDPRAPSGSGSDLGLGSRLSGYADGGRSSGPGVLSVVVAAVLVLGLAAGVVWMFSQPLDGRGTVSASQLAAQDKHPATIHGIRKLQPGEASDKDEVAP